jgi:phosphoribosylformylglycinamidine (FGAM) synthase PurS component
VPVTGVEVLVRLATADPWSFTVFDTLRRKLGYGEITDVTRIKAWQLAFDLDPDGAAAATHRLLADTALLANPNRDRWCVRGLAGRELRQTLWLRRDAAGCACVVKVTDNDDPIGKSMLRVLRSRLGMGEIVDVKFSWIWVLEAGADPVRAMAIASEAAVSRSWRRGLLSNPHYQHAEVLRADRYLPSEEVEA